MDESVRAVTLAGRLLVADDDEPMREATARVLRGAGYEVRTAIDGEEALTIALETRPDVVVADVNMPGIDGRELCRRIKADPALRGTLVMMYSAARTSSHDQADGLDAGADGYVAQPVSNREVVARVRSMMRIKRAEDERDRLIGELQDALAKVK
ncbi:MAG: response regulator, partial [Deltaproteobacteria bacterium]